MGTGCLSKDSPTGNQNPIRSNRFVAPLMSDEELARVMVPFASVAEELPRIMAKYGVAIVTDVVSSEEVVKLENLWAQDLEGIVEGGGFQASQGARAFPQDAVRQLTSGGAGFILGKALPHGQFAWAVRRNANVHATFAALFPEDAGSLVTSVDVPFFTPKGQQAQSSDFSAHCDQNQHDIRSGLATCDVYQGVLYIWPTDNTSSTTVVWPGSHREHWLEMMNEPAFVSSGKEGFHYCELREMGNSAVAQKLAQGWACEARRCPVPAGALLLWNSRTLHTGWKAGARLAMPVCLEPAHRRNACERLSKLRLCALGLPSTHWASQGMQHDMCLGDPGVFSRPDAAAEPGALALRPALRPAPLAENADMGGLRKLVNVNYRYTGMWEAPDAAADLLEASVREEFKEYL